ncbi:lpg0008 family Dot/Icm T4SS effector [Legionella maioricensis]|uniref:Dot/Icm T4SS effector n=1 Tax=Legionella maioricensis TaxID=2896528 RepID=A0A9X2CYK9_9GAMM|nr:lpg0008 family Dot/Icm T4SS effector [Legionella maioricensis]MCL9683131.1 hypothetical protein [Legionella maioricensis]MCL9688030.1 hypothetical protein [Legionella maioricensis]
MTFTCEQIKQLEKPYQDLGSSDALAEHRDELNKLSPKEMQDLASRMILACPQEELDSFGEAIHSLASTTEEPSFHAVISQAHAVKKHILRLLDPTHKSPHDLLMDEEASEELFIPFKALALKILENNESAIAGRLALATPAKSRSQLSHHLNNTFNGSELAAKTAAAFTVCRDIERFLLGVKPEEFFTSPEFNVDLCLEFSMLFAPLLKGHEQAIGEKLSLLEPKVRHGIGRKLEMMCPNAHDKQSPFRLIAAAMTSKEMEHQQETPVQTEKPIEIIPNTSNPNGMFNSQLRARKASTDIPKSAPEYEYESGSESGSDEEQESRLSSCCG